MKVAPVPIVAVPEEGPLDPVEVTDPVTDPVTVLGIPVGLVEGMVTPVVVVPGVTASFGAKPASGSILNLLVQHRSYLPTRF